MASHSFDVLPGRPFEILASPGQPGRSRSGVLRLPAHGRHPATQRLQGICKAAGRASSGNLNEEGTGDMSYAHAADVATLSNTGAGDDGRDAWDRLVAAYEGMLIRIGRSYRLDLASIQDATQETWLAAFNSLGSLRDPERVGSWLATVMHRNCLRLRRRLQREEPQDPTVLYAMADRAEENSPEGEAIAHDERASVADAMRQLPNRQQQLLAALLTDDSYKHIGETLNMRIGSIGPTRARALCQLRAALNGPLDRAS